MQGFSNFKTVFRGGVRHRTPDHPRRHVDQFPHAGWTPDSEGAGGVLSTGSCPFQLWVICLFLPSWDRRTWPTLSQLACTWPLHGNRIASEVWPRRANWQPEGCSHHFGVQCCGLWTLSTGSFFNPILPGRDWHFWFPWGCRDLRV